MSGDISSGPLQARIFELPFVPIEVPDAVPEFVRELAPAAYILQCQPLEPIIDGIPPTGLTLPAGFEVAEGNWTAVRTASGLSGDSAVECVSFFGAGLEEHTTIVSHGSDGSLTELERVCRNPISLRADTRLTAEELTGLMDTILDPAMQVIASFALSGSRQVPENLSGVLAILKLDGPKITLGYRIGSTLVVYRPLEERAENGARGREFQEEIYTNIGELAPGTDPAGHHPALGIIKGQTLIRYTAPPVTE